MPFEMDHLLVPPGQGFGGDKNAADVLHDLAFRELVQGLMGERPASGAEIGQDGGDDALGEPAHRGAGPFGLLNIVDARCGGTFANIDDVISAKERSDFMAGYKAAAGLAIESLNRAPATIPSGARLRTLAAI